MTTSQAAGPAPDLTAIIERIRPTMLAGERTLPVCEVLQPVFPLGGLVRGTRVAVRGTGAASICMAALAEASRAGSWVAVVGIGSWGWSAAARAGLSLERTVFVTEPPVSQWGTVIAALVDAVDVVVVDPTHQVTGSDARRLLARSRERGSIVMEVGIDDGRRRFRWPTEADLTLSIDTASWSGLDNGHGSLSERVVNITTDGRRGAARSRAVQVCIDASGRVGSVPGVGVGAGVDVTVDVTAGAAGGRHLRSVG